ncbi:MAG: DNA repair protein RecO [Anaerolinea sp.]|nr:DNA repair protein RecO [Anaerolinea sp.]
MRAARSCSVSDRPRVYTTEGVILRRRNIGEADSIFTVFSPTEGKFDAVARGVRKARSHMRGHLEPLTRSKLLIAHGRTLDVFTQAETISGYRAIREDLDACTFALYCAELIDRFSADREPHQDVYSLLLDVLDALDAKAPPHAVRHFELSLLSFMGYEPQFDACALCGARLAEEDVLLSASAGGFVCHDCRSRAGAGRVISVRAIKVLRYTRASSLAQFAALKLDEQLGREVQSAVAELIRYALDREPLSGKYLDQVARLPRLAPPVSDRDDVQSL